MEYLLANTLFLDLVVSVSSARRAVDKTTILRSRRTRVVRDKDKQQQQQQQLHPMYQVSSIILEDMPSSSCCRSYLWRKQAKQRERLRQKLYWDDCCCDESTLETVNTSCEEDETSVSSGSATNGLSVSFATPMITEVRYRPYVLTREEKRDLFYCEEDFRAFRNDFFQQRRLALLQEKRPRKVQFIKNLVSEVRVFEETVDKEAKFYSESDLQRFLDEFVASLNGMFLIPPREQQQA